MNVETIKVERTQALEMWKKYQLHKHNQSRVDAEIERIYKMLATGKVLIDALDAVAKAGANEFDQPKLAIVRADQKMCFLTLRTDGSAFMWGGALTRNGSRPWSRAQMAASLRFDFGPDFMPRRGQTRELQAIAPHIPPDLRPRRGLQNYHILFEAEWTRSIPIDPMLVRRIGKSNLWIVLCAWDLTSVERAVLAGHTLQ